MLRSSNQSKPWSDDASAPPKQKSKERLSRLFSKRGSSKQKKEPAPAGPSANQTSLSRHTSVRSTPPARYDSLRRQPDHDDQIFSTVTSSSSFYENDSQLSSVEKNLTSMSSAATATANLDITSSAFLSPQELRLRIHDTQRELQKWTDQHQQLQQENSRLEDQLQKSQQRRADRAQALEHLQQQYQNHVRSLRAMPDDLDAIKTKLEKLQQGIGALADRLLPHLSPDHTYQILATFWLNLRDVLVPMIPFSNSLVRHLTEKFISDVLLQNLTLHDMVGCACSEDYTTMYHWLQDHQLDDLATDLRQHLARSVVRGQKEQEIKQHLEHTIRQHWKYLYSGLRKAYPFIYQHDTSDQNDLTTHFGAQVQQLVDQAAALGFSMKGFEQDITPTAVEEGTQLLDPDLMDDLNGHTEGIIQFCVSPPFRLVHQPHPLVKGRVICMKK
ncbi:hypothetical protein DM01DRAFT_1335427 [Hesseltinella vesiculosa]|uniref:Uncharacterized protein n=1 Tax=Hesseltinella vesiculosa TaxID=101127 RepID=A0A1X2GJB0_9FUNG|nr:hypothetical protein DM01DRAFT_1335427 [Hesseltinella vesiculosa]